VRALTSELSPGDSVIIMYMDPRMTISYTMKKLQGGIIGSENTGGLPGDL
jgi:hypothetical protein